MAISSLPATEFGARLLSPPTKTRCFSEMKPMSDHFHIFTREYLNDQTAKFSIKSNPIYLHRRKYLYHIIRWMITAAEFIDLGINLPKAYQSRLIGVDLERCCVKVVTSYTRSSLRLSIYQVISSMIPRKCFSSFFKIVFVPLYTTCR